MMLSLYVRLNTLCQGRVMLCLGLEKFHHKFTMLQLMHKLICVKSAFKRKREYD